tara:strand:+ start:896 stop:1576 length:681 start_codon:yes stop_codon:yes gene_type:complete
LQPRILGKLECAAASAAQTKLRAIEGAQLRLKTYVRRNGHLKDLKFINIAAFHGVTLLAFLVFSIFGALFGLAIDSVSRSLAGRQLIEYSIGLSSYLAYFYFLVAAMTMAFKTTTGSSGFTDTSFSAQFPIRRPRIILFWLLLFLGGIISGISTKSSYDDGTHMTAAILAFIPIHWMLDTVLLCKSNGSKISCVRTHGLQFVQRAAISLLLVGTFAAVLFFRAHFA